MTLVVDASAVIDLLVRSDRGDRVRAVLAERAEEHMAAVAHLDEQVFSGLARLHRADDLDADDVAVLLRRLGDLAIARLPITARLLDAAWALRDTVAAPDALYVAAAQAVSADLVTTDDRLARAAGDVAVDLDGEQIGCAPPLVPAAVGVPFGGMSQTSLLRGELPPEMPDDIDEPRRGRGHRGRDVAATHQLEPSGSHL